MKKLIICAAIALAVACTSSYSGKVDSAGDSVSAKGNPASDELPADTLDGIEIDVDGSFTIAEIDDDLFERIKGKSYKSNCTVPRSELRYLEVLHYTPSGEVKVGELICNKSIAEDLVDIFRNLYDAKYPIERMVLIDEYDADDTESMRANNTSCFNFRKVAGQKNLSKHAYGKAIDINPLYNPYVKARKDGSLYVSPENGKAYADRSKDFPMKIDKEDLCYKEFIKHGFKWGGDWKTLKDYQHFQKE